MIANLWMGYRDLARGNSEENKAYKALGDPRVRSIFKLDVQGQRDYELWSLYYEVETEQELRDIRNDLNAEFPGQVRTIGAWWWDGRMVGQEFEYDEEGNITGTTGQPIFPLHTSILGYMPDVYDPITETYSPATELADTNLGLGQQPRRFS